MYTGIIEYKYTNHGYGTFKIYFLEIGLQFENLDSKSISC